MTNKRKCIAVVRVRGVWGVAPDIKKTLEILHLNQTHHITLVDNRASFLGMLRRARNFVTWGEPTKDNILLLLKERGRILGNRRVDDEYIKRIGYKTLEDLALAIYEGKTDLRHVKGLKPVFRAHPPKKGYKGKVKKSYSAKGVTGYRGEAINDLIQRMI